MALAGTGAELQHLTPRPVKDLWGSNYLNIAGNDFNFATIRITLVIQTN